MIKFSRTETQILFLLIEKMGEQTCEIRKIGLSVYRFTKEEVRATTGWSNRSIEGHLAILESTGHVAISDMKYRILLSSRVVNRIEYSGIR